MTIERANKWLRANKRPAQQTGKAIKLSKDLVRLDDFQDLLSTKEEARTLDVPVDDRWAHLRIED